MGLIVHASTVMLGRMSRRVVYEDGEGEAQPSRKPDPFKGRRSPRGPRQYVYGLADVCAAAGLSEAATWKAMQRARVKIDDFRALVAWLASRKR